MSFPHHDPYSQPASGSLVHHDDFEQMKNAISQRDEVIAQLMQQAEKEAGDKNNRMESDRQKKDKGKGCFKSSQNQLPQSENPSGSSKPSKLTTTAHPLHSRPASSIKRHPIQMLMRDAPPDFKYTKEALYVHTKLLWGMLTPAAFPIAPDKQLLKEFYQRFSSAKEVQSVAQNSQGVKLISEAQVQTLRDARSGKRKIGKNIVNMQDFYITYVHAMLAKLGIRIWAPDSLYNEACRIVALMTFRQIACSGTYQYMRANLTYCSDIGLLRNAYDHYVHYVLAEKYKKENKEQGWTMREVERKVIQRARQRVAFVPVKDLPPGTKQHPDKRLGNLSFNQKYWESTIQEYEIKPGTPDSSERNSEDSCSDDESVDLNAPNANRDVDNNGLSEEFIYNGESNLELDEEDDHNEMEENQDKVGGDVVMSDAWETRKRVNWQQEDMYEKVW
ncbi:hypothetical protein O181_107672 [Austropuccinia psidii MF-1]|uniref:Uncharacterized protein n=1 Tax=Austropuccinia psidii MF-1 TaxID=1389203 RepID=A0A9Q3JSS1_9BASI|nr:hypothetical protein [Austropuccinia psidii MF-1]